LINQKKTSYNKSSSIFRNTGYYINNNIDNFTNASEFLEEDSSIKFEDISKLVNEHLTNLEKLFNQYFPEDIRVNDEWIEQPFAVDIMSNDSK
jgi:hypothetical protein